MAWETWDRITLKSENDLPSMFPCSPEAASISVLGYLRFPKERLTIDHHPIYPRPRKKPWDIGSRNHLPVALISVIFWDTERPSHQHPILGPLLSAKATFNRFAAFIDAMVRDPSLQQTEILFL